MNTTLWIIQLLMAAAFLYSGACKTFLPERKLVDLGQTGVEGLHPWAIKGIGLSEIAGSIGLIIPAYFHIMPVLTPIAAICLAMIMPFAAKIHYRRKEYRNVLTNIIFFLLCSAIATGRLLLHFS